MSPQTVWRYSLELGPGLQRVQMPRGAQVLSAANQGEQLCVWARVEPGAAEMWRWLLVLTTGAPMPTERKERPRFVGTVLFSGGAYVVHVFDLGGPEL